MAFIVFGLALIAAALIYLIIASAGNQRCAWTLDFMPSHPERVQPIGDEDADEAFGDIAEHLLDDGLADVCEQLGWIQ